LITILGRNREGERENNAVPPVDDAASRLLAMTSRREPYGVVDEGERVAM
jgi:hypothetical protein